MAIRIPNLGTGNGQTGDNEFKIRSDYNHNFSDQSNAASRLVGLGPENLVPAKDVDRALSGSRSYYGPEVAGTYPDKDSVPIGTAIFVSTNAAYPWLPVQGHDGNIVQRVDVNAISSLVAVNRNTGETFRSQKAGSTWTEWARFYTDKNTTKEENTVF